MKICQLVVLLNTILTGCIYGHDPYTELDFPFSAGSKGSVSDVNFHVDRGAKYSFYLAFYLTDHDQSTIDLILGSPTKNNGFRGVPEIPIPIRLTIWQIDEGQQQMLVDMVIPNGREEDAGGGFEERILVRNTLGAGNYHLRVEALANVVELRQVPVHLRMHISQGS